MPPAPGRATFYVQLRPLHSPWGPAVTGCRAKRLTQRKPDEPDPGCVVVKLTVEIPLAAFEPLAPEAVVVIPAELVQHPIAVAAQDARA